MLLEAATRTQDISLVLMENPSNYGSIEVLETEIAENKFIMRSWEFQNLCGSCENFIGVNDMVQ